MKQKNIKTTAQNILSFRDHSVAELRKKLKLRTFPVSEIDTVIAELTDDGWIDDDKLCRHQVEYIASTKLVGRRYIAAKLYEKGFENSLIKEAIAESEVDFVEICRKRIEKSNYADREKLFAALSRYGFSTSEILKALEKQE